MCRIAAYIGPPCRLDAFLTAPEHSLCTQSWAAREMTSATVNADGWGVAWLDAAGRPAVYRNILPVWADMNVEGLGRSLTSRLWLGNVRSATAGLGTDHANTQPFCDDRLVFTHNGYIGRFAHTLRATIRAALDADIEVDIAGNTDSEYLFALLRQQRGTLAERVGAALALIRTWLAERPEVIALLNILVSDGFQLVAARSAIHAQPPSLYVHPNWRGGVAIASEAFDSSPGWQSLSADEMIVTEHGRPLHKQRL